MGREFSKELLKVADCAYVKQEKSLKANNESDDLEEILHIDWMYAVSAISARQPALFCCKSSEN